MKLYYRLLLILLLLLCRKDSFAQDTLRIENVRTVSKGETLKIMPGTVVMMAPGAKIWVEGSIIIGANEAPKVIICSEDPSKPGSGIIINGMDLQGSVNIQNTVFKGLSQTLSFEPFWCRQSVFLNQISIQQSAYNDAVLYVAQPLTNQNTEPISFKLLNSTFQNNSSGVLIDHAGANGFKVELDNLVFQENQTLGNDPSLGLLHLNIATPFTQNNLVLGKIAFYHNTASGEEIGLSLSGNTENVLGNSLYTENGNRLVYDYLIDPRLPSYQGKVLAIQEFPGNACFVYHIKHFTQKIAVQSAKSCAISALLDSLGHNLEFTQTLQHDSLMLYYKNGIAKTMVTENGLVIPLPPVEEEKIEIPVVIAPPPAPEKKDSILPAPKFKPTYELGAWGGLAVYVGDIKQKFGIPGTYEWSGGLYFQYNKKENWSYRATFYRTNIGMHDPTAALQIWQSAPTFQSNNGVIKQRNSWENNFKTKMYILDFDAIYYFAPKHNLITAVKNNKEEGYWIPGFGFGAGFMKYDPYRCVVYSKSKDTAEYIALRSLGTEGQNFLSNKKGYGMFTLNINVSFQLAYAYKNFRLRYELKSVLSFSDYLDDYGQGYTYGGNYDKWKDANGNVDMPVDKHTGKQVSIEKAFPKYNSNIIRTNNMLPDMFFQHHIGVSYNLGELFKK